MTNILGEEQIQSVLDLACKAGQLAMDMRKDISIEEKTGPKDLVTSADLALSDLIVRTLKADFPDTGIVSEEDPDIRSDKDLVWVIDPIDGTQNYILQDGQYSVMIGLLQNLKPVFGCVFEPEHNNLYFGGPQMGAWKIKTDTNEKTGLKANKDTNIFKESGSFAKTRLMMGHRDRKKHPWVEDLEYVNFVQFGSIGLKVARILENRADLFVHLAGKLKVWDTAAPSAIAIAAGLEVGTMNEDTLSFPLPEVFHRHPVIIGRKGSLNWCRKTILNETAKFSKSDAN
ncbi:MAG: hypothetical protein KIT34_06755 [Cyanobacteria bacterium TGS_CYA1]|nr:hypothetical protein [Cyanobacteria bacterium TGS_CYA1]